MTNAVATAALAQATPPIAATLGPVVFTLKDATGAVVGTPQAIGAGANDTSSTATFSSVPPGNGYTITGQRVDGDGNPVGSPFVTPGFNVLVAVNVSVVTGISVSLVG